jgi:hypothetical protein
MGSCCEARKPNLWQRIKWWFGSLKRRYEPSALEVWAKAELDRVLAQCDDDEGRMMQKAMNDGVMRVVKMFCKEGHSGFSAGYAIGMIRRLLDWKPITPLTGEENEWRPVHEWDAGDNSQQNARCSAVFRKNFDNSTAYYLYGKVFSDNGGQSWFTNGKSRVPVTFPYNVPLESERVLVEPEDGD